MRNWSVLTLTVFVLFSSFLRAEVPGFGISDRYVGILRHEKTKRDQLAKIDFILSREDNNATVIRAILTLHLGDFKSGEYVAYDFDDVKYSLLEKAFVFVQKEHGVTLIARQLSPLEMTAEFTSVHSGQVGTLRLRSDKPVAPELPLLEPVWGEYRGKCASTFQKGQKAETVVQLYTYRSGVENTEVSRNAFRAYNIKGFIGEEYEKRCFLHPEDKICLLANVDSGTYNFFENQLFIYCNARDMGCIPAPDGLQCERCEFLKRVSPEIAGPRVMAPPQPTSVFQLKKDSAGPALQGTVPAVAGLYKGYVHHEYLNNYQAAQLRIATYQSGTVEDPRLNLSADATLFFGDWGSNEAISYRFAERLYPKPLVVTQFVLDSPDPSSDIDAVLQITTLGDGVVKGVWYSRIFGRVGNFEMYREGAPALPSDAQKMGLVSGNYDGPGLWEFDILVNLSSAQPTTQNPFAPLTFAGYEFFRGTGKRDRLSGGSYDFYTGRMSLESDEDNKRTHIGQRVSRNKLLMRSMLREFLTPIEPFRLDPFKLVGSRP